MLGVEGEVWTIVIDKDDNIYVGTKRGDGYGNVYKCLANKNSFRVVPGIDKCVPSLTFDSKGNLYAGTFTGDSRKEARNGAVYRCLAGESEFKLIKGIKNGDGVISLAYDNNTNILYASTFNGKNKIDTRDGALYEYDLTEIWHLEIRDGAPFTDNEYYLNINRNMVWK